MTTKALKEGMGSINVEETISIDRIRKLAGIANGIENSIGQEVTHTSLNPEANVEEAVGSAMAIDDSFQKMFNMMDRLLKFTREAGVLSKMVEREGGDSAWIAEANQKLIEAQEAIEEAHMYSQPPQDVDENGLEFESLEIESGQE